ncbi:MAG: hypothetical protein HYV19_01025 [Gemmatimonadetes bacterium]|nr:hypothetical protein [Gemmatimonadota bacterium]
MNDVARALDRRTALATVVIALLLGLFAMNELPVGVFQDDGHYMILARAIASGDGYRYMNLPGAPAATHFPPGYPLLLAPLWWIAPRFPANVAYFKLINVALLPIVALAIRALARQSGALSVPVASAVALMSVATVPVLFLNSLLFSETAFMAAFFALLIAGDRFLTRDDAGSVRTTLLLGVAIGALALLRTVGVTLLPAALAVLLWRRRWRDAALLCGGALVLLLPWQIWTSLHAQAVPAAVSGGYGGYGPWLAAAWRDGGAGFVRDVVAVNLRGLLLPLMLFGLNDAPPVVRAAAVAALLALAARGAWRVWPRAPLTILVFVPYGALILLWPFPPDRFLWPLWPIVLMLLVAGGAPLAVPGRAPWARRLAPITLAVLAASLVVWNARTWPTRSWETGQRGNAHMGLAVAAVAATLPRDGLVAADQDAMVHLYAGRPAVPILALTAIQHVRERTERELVAQVDGVISAYHPRWLLVAERESLRAAQALARSGRLKLVAADTAGVLVYDVVR